MTPSDRRPHAPRPTAIEFFAARRITEETYRFLRDLDPAHPLVRARAHLEERGTS